MRDDHSLDDDLARLAALQASLRALEDPDADLSSIDAELAPGLQRRLAARIMDESIRAERVARAQQDLEFLERRARHLATLALSHPVRIRRPTPPARVTPPPSPPAPPLMPAKRRRRRVAVPELPVFWSPTPVLGFRVWAVKDRLLGVQRAWTQRRYTAGCIDFGEVDDPEVPHTDGRCRPPPCGLYAAKEVGPLIDEFGLPPGGRRWAYGMVALSGKVVEHTRGFRARHATAVSVVVAERNRLIRVEGAEWLDLLFASPRAAVERIEDGHPEWIEVIADGGLLRERLAAILDEARLIAEAAGIDLSSEEE